MAKKAYQYTPVKDIEEKIHPYIFKKYNDKQVEKYWNKLRENWLSEVPHDLILKDSFWRYIEKTNIPYISGDPANQKLLETKEDYYIAFFEPPYKIKRGKLDYKQGREAKFAAWLCKSIPAFPNDPKIYWDFDIFLFPKSYKWLYIRTNIQWEDVGPYFYQKD